MKTKLNTSLFFMGLILFIFMSVISNAQLNWEKYEDNPVLEGEPGDWNENIFYSVVIYEDNLFKMWYCGWEDDSRQIGYAWSPDGIDWNLYEDPVIAEGDPGDWDFHRYPGTVLHIGDTWHMWYAGSTNSGDNFSIGYAWADEENVWNLEPDPVLEKGESGEWDDFFVLKPSVYFDGTTYHMYYTGMNVGGSHMNIGYATSPDGKTWDKFPVPVITVSESGYFYDSWVGSHGLIHYNDTLRMFYEGFDGEGSPWLGFFRVGYAWTTDYINWNIVTEWEPVLDVGDPGSWDEHWSANPTVLMHDSYLKMWYTGYQNGGYHKIGYALGDFHTGLPDEFELIPGVLAVSPNPFTDHVTLTYRMTGNSPVTLEVYNINGQLNSTFVNEVKQQGKHEVTLEGRELKPGIYFCVLKTNEGIQTKKLIKL